MAMVKIKSGKTVKVGSRSKGGGYEYEVQADGSIKNLTTGRTTSPATVQKAMAPAKAARTSKAMVGATAEKKPPVPKARPAAKVAPIPKTRPIKMTSAAARPEGSASGMPQARLSSTVATPTGPKGRGGRRGASPVVRPVGFTEKRRSGGIFGLDIIKNN